MVKHERQSLLAAMHKDDIIILDVDVVGTYFDLVKEGIEIKKACPDVYDRYIFHCVNNALPGTYEYYTSESGFQFIFMFVNDRMYGSGKDDLTDVLLNTQVIIDDIVKELDVTINELSFVSGIMGRKFKMHNLFLNFIRTQHPTVKWKVVL